MNGSNSRTQDDVIDWLRHRLSLPKQNYWLCYCQVILLHTRTAGIDTNHSTTFTLLQESALCVDKGGYSSNCKIVSAELLQMMAIYSLPFSKSVKSNVNRNFWYIQNNHIKTTKNFLSPIQSWSVKFQKNCSPIQSCPAKIDFSPDPVRSSPDPCSSLLQTRDERTVKFFSPSPIQIRKILKIISPIQSWSANIKPCVLFCLMRQNSLVRQNRHILWHFQNLIRQCLFCHQRQKHCWSYLPLGEPIW